MLSHVEDELARARLTPGADQRGGDADVPRIVGDTIRPLQHTEAGERLSWEADLQEGLTAPIDPHDFRELVGNLLENASKCPKSCVAVTAVRCDGFIRVVVEDNGPGVSPERLPDLLRRGVRLDRLKPGSGLSLAIVSEIANVYNLALTLENRVEGGLRAAVTCSDPLPSPETGYHGTSERS